MERAMSRLKPVTPGELLREEFLVPMGITRYRLAKEIGVPAERIGEIVAGRRAITGRPGGVASAERGYARSTRPCTTAAP
jgi:hypothetical protein